MSPQRSVRVTTGGVTVALTVTTSGARRIGGGTGFILSDHADWPGLNAAIRATGAGRVFVTHGYTDPFRRWLSEQGYDARIVAPSPGARPE